MTRILIGLILLVVTPSQIQAQTFREATDGGRLGTSAVRAHFRVQPPEERARMAAMRGLFIPKRRRHADNGLFAVATRPSNRSVASEQNAHPSQDQQSGARTFNPDIGMIGNLVGALGPSKGGSETLAPLPLITLQESEVSLQSVIDPFARADFFLAIGEEGIEVEEGFVTFTALPHRLQVKAGKMRANFGRLNAFHNHTLPWIDRPLVMFNLLGGEATDPDTGIKDAGISVSQLIPAGKLFLEATGELFRGESGTLYASTERNDFSVVGHVRTYADFSTNANIEVGASYSRGHNDVGSAFVTQLFGTDITYRWRPVARAIYRSLAARTELIWSHRTDLTMTQRAFGLYASLDYQFARRWTAGGRFDLSDRGQLAAVRDRGASGVLTFKPSEFSSLRGQYRRTRFGDDGRVANELLFQVLFIIGAHGAHPF